MQIFDKYTEKNINIKRLCKAIFSNIDTSLLLEECFNYKNQNLKGGIISKLTPIDSDLTPVSSKNVFESNKYQCKYCYFTFSKNCNLRRHENYRCKVQKELMNENEALKNRIKETEKKRLITTTNGDTTKKWRNNDDTNNNTINNKINADVRFNVYDKEQLKLFEPPRLRLLQSHRRLIMSRFQKNYDAQNKNTIYKEIKQRNEKTCFEL